ncbi:type II toxin-antitoxin system Phd/YefM family antitoxin [bacterium]|nr:type II toxin-antitoxin system Phd/YefM family antitoxin [bacterium]
MKPSTNIKPISYLKANASDVVNQLQEQSEPMIITQNGEAKIVVQDIESYEKTQQTLALLKLLALGQQQIETGQVVEVSTAIERIRARRTDPE